MGKEKMETGVVRILVKPEDGDSLFSLKRKYVIPIYQREYSWGEKEVKRFMESVFQGFFGPGGADVFMGTVQFRKDPDGPEDGAEATEYDVIDGQQRITTILLLISLLNSDAGSLSGRSLEQSGVALRYDDNETGGEALRKALAVPYGEVESVPKDKKGRRKFDDVERDNYARNLCFLRDCIDAKGRERKFDKGKLLEFVLRGVYFVELVTTGIPLPKVVQIFNTINTTGLDLDCSDMFKLQFYEYLHNREKGKGEDGWMKKINDLYNQVKEANSKNVFPKPIEMEWIIDTFKYVLVAENGYSSKRLLEATDTFFDEFFSDAEAGKVPGSSLPQFSDFEALTKRFIDLYIKAHVEDENGLVYMEKAGASAAECLSEDLIGETRYGRHWVFPYADAFFRTKDSSGENEDAIKNGYRLALGDAYALAKYFIVFSTIYDRVLNPVQSFLSNEVLLPFSKNNNPDVISIIERQIVLDPYDDLKRQPSVEDDFFGAVTKDLFSNRKRCFVICKFSDLMDEADSKAKAAEIRRKLFSWSSFKFDLEHIEAKANFDKRYPSDPEAKSLFNGIGNLMCLEYDINRSIGDKTIDEKASSNGSGRSYVDSKLKCVIKIIDIINSGGKKEWTLDDVKVRAKAERAKLEQEIFSGKTQP
jgi:hypothetical protein